jgi:oxygen-independent coproporphyrinogen III oxidase
MDALDLARRLHWATTFPHVFTIQYPPSRDFFREKYRNQEKPELPLDLARVLLYLHVPFCEAKCHYCNFAVDVRKDVRIHRAYVQALVRQIEAFGAALPASTTIPGIDIGGGTPTLLEMESLEKLLVALRPLLIRAEIDHPISIETTPRIASAEPEKLSLLRDLGVSRVSVGIQSTNDETLASVNRRAQTSLTDAALRSLVTVGFHRTNVDLVFGLPGQTIAHFREDLQRVANAGVDSITTYDCLYRGEGRVLPRKVSEYPTMAEYRAFYDFAHEFLQTHGYTAQYGSLNYSKHPAETGTSPYFEGRLLRGLPYVGLGSYASSLLGRKWFFAPYGTAAYVASIDAGDMLPVMDGYDLPAEERMAKSVLAMLNFGVIHREYFAQQFGVMIDDVFRRALDVALARGWLEDSGAYLGVTSGRFADMPSIRALFYSVEAMNWVEREGKRLPLFRSGS